jgi:hypothetical protein
MKWPAVDHITDGNDHQLCGQLGDGIMDKI